MSDKQLQKKLIAIAIPIILSNLVSQVQMLIDRIFLGRLDITCMSAVGNASSPIWTTMNVVFSLSVGSAILMSQAIGAGDKDRAKQLAASLMKYVNVFSVALFFVWTFGARTIFAWMNVDAGIIDMSVDYVKYYAPTFLLIGLGSAISTILQVSEKTVMLAVYGVVRSVINIVLDYALIFGHFKLPRMEVAGASLATTIAELVGDVIVFTYFVYNKEIWLRPSFMEIVRAKVKLYIESIKLGVASACEDFAWNIGNLFLIVMLNQISAAAAGVYSIVFGVELLPVCIFGSFGPAVLTLSGQETGKKNPKGVGKVVKIALRFSLTLAAVMLIIFILFPKTIIGWFTTDRDIIVSAGAYLLIVGIDLFPKSMNIIIGSGIKGHGDTKWMLGTQIFGTIFVIGMSAVMVLVFHMGIGPLFWLVVADEAIRCTINSWKLGRITRG